MVSLEGKLRLHTAMTNETVAIGTEREPVLVVDNFLANADVLVDYAAVHASFEGVSDAFYPGVRAPIPPIYSFAVRAFLGALIADAFALGARQVVKESASFSLVTTPPERLRPLQRLPHFDSTDPQQLAVLHYLCGPEHGGTAFYRHRATGFETMSEARFPAYKAAIEGELAAAAPAARYCDDDVASFERIAAFDSAFNRVLVYRSAALHSARIAPDESFSPNPRSGRLTANLFFIYR